MPSVLIAAVAVDPLDAEVRRPCDDMRRERIEDQEKDHDKQHLEREKAQAMPDYDPNHERDRADGIDLGKHKDPKIKIPEPEQPDHAKKHEHKPDDHYNTSSNFHFLFPPSRSVEDKKGDEYNANKPKKRIDDRIIKQISQIIQRRKSHDKDNNFDRNKAHPKEPVPNRRPLHGPDKEQEHKNKQNPYYIHGIIPVSAT